MKHTRAALVAGLSLAAASVGAFVPAHANGNTPVTFTLSAGDLTISAPSDTQNLGTGDITPGSQVGAVFDDEVTVTDNRGRLAAAWLVTVSTQGFTGQTEGGDIGPENARYTTVGAIDTSAGLVVTPTLGLTMATDPTLAGAGVGSNSASWTPRVDVTVPMGAVADTYNGTIVHSVTPVLP